MSRAANVHLAPGHMRVCRACVVHAITSCARLVQPRRGAPRGRSPRAGPRVAWAQPQLLAHGPGHVGKRCPPRDRRRSTHPQLAPQREGTSREGAVVPPQPSRDARSSGRARQRRVPVVCAGERHGPSHVAVRSALRSCFRARCAGGYKVSKPWAWGVKRTCNRPVYSDQFRSAGTIVLVQSTGCNSRRLQQPIATSSSRP